MHLLKSYHSVHPPPPLKIQDSEEMQHFFFFFKLLAWGLNAVKFLRDHPHSIIRKGVPAPPTFLRQPPLDPACPPFLKIFLSLSLFSVPPHFKVF